MDEGAQMMNRKIPVLLSIIFLLCLGLNSIVTVNAQTITLEDSYAWSNGDNVTSAFYAQHPSASAVGSEVGQLFNATQGNYLYSAKFLVHKDGTPDITLQSFLLGCGGVATNDPNATVFATSSNTISTTTLSDGDNNVTFYFETEAYNLVQNEPYYIVLRLVTVVSGDVNNHLHFLVDASDSNHLGGYSRYYSSAYDVVPTNDMIFEVYGASVSIPTDPDSYPDLDWDSPSGIITGFSRFAIPLVVLLLPVLLLATITRSTDKWIILIGLTIGAGLGFYFGMVPLWLVFLVVIGLIGMAYQSVRGGG